MVSPNLNAMKNGTQKSLDRRQEIYLIAAQMFVEKGFDSILLADIAAALSITKAGLPLLL